MSESLYNIHWLKLIDKELNSLFDEDWGKKVYDLAKSKADETNVQSTSPIFNHIFSQIYKIELEEFTDKKLLILFEHLNKSILKGECFLNDFSSVINEVIRNSNKLSVVDFSYLDNEESQLFLEDFIYNNNPFHLIKDCLIEYKTSARYIIRQYENPSLNTLFDLSDNTDDLIHGLYKNDKGEIQKALFSLTQSNLFFLRKEFNLEYKPETLQELLINKNRIDKSLSFLKQNSSQDIKIMAKILIDKGLFLIRKFVIRKSKEKDVHNENYVFLGDEIDFNLDSHKLNLPVFELWDVYSENHFLSEDNNQKCSFLKSEAKKITLDNNEFFKKTHSLIKYHKDLNPKLNLLTELKQKIDSLDTPTLNFDVYSGGLIKNYIYNNCFSYVTSELLKEESIEIIIKKVKIELSEIEILQEKTSINNFFPYYKTCKLLHHLVDSELKKLSFNNENSQEKIANIHNAITFLKESFQIYKDNLKWSSSHLNYAYQLPYKESIVFYENIEVFSSSTFSLPIKFDKYDNFIEEMNAFILRTDNEIKSLGNIFSIMTVFSENKNKLKETIENNTQKNIELLGIFSAIIALTLGGISITGNKTSFEEKLLVFISLFSVLFLFIVLLKSYIKNDENSKYKIILFFCLTMLLLASIITIFYNILI
mgnify:CR=1 FL=1